MSFVYFREKTSSMWFIGLIIPKTEDTMNVNLTSDISSFTEIGEPYKPLFLGLAIFLPIPKLKHLFHHLTRQS